MLNGAKPEKDITLAGAKKVLEDKGFRVIKDTGAYLVVYPEGEYSIRLRLGGLRKLAVIVQEEGVV